MFKIWHDNNIDLAHWLRENTILRDAEVECSNTILLQPNNRRFAQLPDLIKDILYLDKPDIIVTFTVHGSDNPILALEFMEHTPQGQHPKQRFCRLAAAAENHVPCAFILPEVKTQHDYRYSCTPDIFFGLHKLIDAHKVPALGYWWPHQDGILLMDERHEAAPCKTGHILALLEFVNLVIESANRGEDPSLLLDDPIVRDRIEFMREEAYATPVTVDRYGTLSLIDTAALVDELVTNYVLDRHDLPDYFVGRERSLVFAPEYAAKRSRESFRTDPYAGMLAFFDYCFARIGTVRQRRYNLVFKPVGITYGVMEEMYRSYWKNNCPFGMESLENIPLMTLHLRKGCTYTKNKQLRIFGYLADMIIFNDFVLYG